MAKKRIPVQLINKSRKGQYHSGEPIPLSQLARRPEFELMDPKDLHIVDCESDPGFTHRWSRVISADLPLVHTRVAIGDILMGFVRERSDPAEVVIDPPPTDKEIRFMLDLLHEGGRPHLVVYEIGRDDAPAFACSDDMAILAAYRAFGAVQVPVAILGEPTRHGHAELILRAVDAPDETAHYLENTRESEILLDAALTLSSTGITVGEILEEDQARLEPLLDRLRQVHKADSAIHYHHVVASTLVRAIRAIDSMRVLLELGRGETLLVIARSLYELATTFYLDWLSPEVMGKIFADAAQIDKGKIQSALIEAVRKDRLREGWSQASADAAAKGTIKLFALARSISDRCKLSPLRMVHGWLYGMLSGFAHQDAAAAADFTGYLSPELSPLTINNSTFIRDASLACQTVRFATGLIAYCVETDIGVGQGAHSNSTQKPDADVDDDCNHGNP